MTPPAGAPVVVVGGGVAGLACAVHLASRGVPVRLFEQKPHAGGRAYSFRDPWSGEAIDNGQHALIEAYAETQRYLGMIGTARCLHYTAPPGLTFHHPARGFVRFRLPAATSQVGLLRALVASDLLSFSDRLNLMRAGIALLHANPADPQTMQETIGDWLARHRQNGEVVRSFWEPLAIAIMNERTNVASASLFLRCLQRAFVSDGGPAAFAHHPGTLVLPSVGLSDLLVHPACSYLTSHGGEITFGARVLTVQANDHRATHVCCANGTRHPAAAIVLAVPPWSLEGMLPSVLPLPGLSRFTPSPIISIHLWFQGDVMPHDALGIVGRTVQWVFNRRRIAPGPATGGHLSCVISAAHDLTDATNEELTALATADLREVFGAPTLTPLHALVIREKRATFSPTPATEPFRPPQRTSLANVFLAGDWTATGLPGTIEGAIWSGRRCADLVEASITAPAPRS